MLMTQSILAGAAFAQQVFGLLLVCVHVTMLAQHN